MLSYECPTCGKTIRAESREQAPFRPFCSQRCKLIDLHKWFSGEYCISDPLPAAPGTQPDSDDEAD